MSPDPDPWTQLGRLAPPGWVVRRHAPRRWWVFRDQRFVAELGVLATGDQWWICPDGDPLPWARTHSTPQAAIEAFTTWWAATHPFE